MPAVFTNSFAQRLDKVCPMNVREAQDGDRVLPGHVYLAPGSRHLELARSPAGYKCRLHDGKPVSGHRPSVDVLFESVARAAGPAAIGVILTGMGQDGAEGLLQMRRRGAHTIGEAAASCVVYGMPRAAMATGAVEKELPLSTIPQAILRYCRAAPAVTR
jgi:two-component system chemotaxis response regulator CheB